MLCGFPLYEGRASMEQTCSSPSHRCWDCDLRSVGVRLARWVFCHVPQAFPERFLGSGGAYCSAREATAIRDCHCHEGVYLVCGGVFVDCNIHRIFFLLRVFLWCTICFIYICFVIFGVKNIKSTIFYSFSYIQLNQDEYGGGLHSLHTCGYMCTHREMRLAAPAFTWPMIALGCSHRLFLSKAGVSGQKNTLTRPI